MASSKDKVSEVNQSIYDFRYAENASYKTDSGLTEDIVRQISKEKHDPDWMLDFRLKSLEIYNSMTIPRMGTTNRWPSHGRYRNLYQAKY